MGCLLESINFDNFLKQCLFLLPFGIVRVLFRLNLNNNAEVEILILIQVYEAFLTQRRQENFVILSLRYLSGNKR